VQRGVKRDRIDVATLLELRGRLADDPGTAADELRLSDLRTFGVRFARGLHCHMCVMPAGTVHVSGAAAIERCREPNTSLSFTTLWDLSTLRTLPERNLHEASAGSAFIGGFIVLRWLQNLVGATLYAQGSFGASLLCHTLPSDLSYLLYLLFVWTYLPWYALCWRHRIMPPPPRHVAKLEVCLLLLGLMIYMLNAVERLPQNAPDSGVVQVGDVLMSMFQLRWWVRFASLALSLGPFAVLSLLHAVGSALSFQSPLGLFEIGAARLERRSTVL
jgi:hypothetical protein